MFLEKLSNLDSILYFLNKILNLIHIIIPIILIIFLSIDLGKAVLSQDDEVLKKVVKSSKNRVIACIAIFFLPTIIQMIFSNVFTSLNMSTEEYNNIIKSYNMVINSNDINAEDNTKSNDISSNMLYSINNNGDTSVEKKLKEEYASKSLNITKDIFSNSVEKTFIKSMCIDNCKIFYDNKSYNLENFFNITYSNASVDSIVYDGNYIISSVILNNSVINNQTFSNTIVYYNYKKVDNSYKIESIKIESQDKIESYLQNLEKRENSKKINLNNKYLSTNKLNYDYSKLNNLSKTSIENTYYKNINNIVMLNTYYNSAVISKATGFFIGNGIIATSWSYIQNSLMNGQTIIIHDINNNSYKCVGIVTMDVESDIAILKLNKEVKRSVLVGDYKKLNSGDPVIGIISKTGYGFTTITGIISNNTKDIVSVLPISKYDWGSPLFNQNSEVIGINTSKSIDSELSVASPIIYLKEIQKTLKTQKFSNIKVKTIEELKKQYFYKANNIEKVTNNIKSDIWDEYKNIGKVEESISLNLIKANYYDKVISLRYENSINNYVETMSFTTDFIINLEKQGYKKTLDTSKKIVYKKGNIKVIIMEEFNYLIIILAKESII